MKLHLDPRHTTSVWMSAIIDRAHPFSDVLPHIVYATLRKRFPDMPISDNPILPADARTARADSFALAEAIFYVTTAASAAVMRLCAANIKAGLRPSLLIPTDAVEFAKLRAADARLDKRIDVVAIEDFVGIKILFMSLDQGQDEFSIFSDILRLYNKRLAEIKADPFLAIQLN